MKKNTLYVAVAIALSGAVSTYFVVNKNADAKNRVETNVASIQMEMSPPSEGVQSPSEGGAGKQTSGTMNTSTGQRMNVPASQPMMGQMASSMQGKSMNMASNPGTLTLPGEIVADKRSEIYAKVLSYVKSIRVDIGSKVKKGDLLMELEAPELTAQLASLQSKVHALEAQALLANSNYERVQKAAKIEGSISQLALDEALTQKESSEAMLAAAKANYEQVKSMTDYLTVRAPFAGVITHRSIDVGSMVGPAASGQKEPLLMIQDNEKLRIKVAVNEKYAPLVSVGDTLSFTVRSLGSEVKAQVSRKAGALDNRLRAEIIEADFVNVSGKLLLGMVGDVVVTIQE